MRRKISLIVLLTMALSLTGCSQLKNEMIEAINNGQEIKLSVEGEVTKVDRVKLEWTELDQLNTFKEIRKAWDNSLNIVNFDTGSKNGPIYIDLDGNWAGNNVLYNVFQNKNFVNEYWNDFNLRSEVSKPAMDAFSDISNESTGIIASINAYFNIIQPNKDGTSGLMNTISRAEAMSAIYRGDTPVIYSEVNKDFEALVGKNEHNIYAYGVMENSYLTSENNSLNYDTYNSAITKGEVIYMLMNRYFKTELDAITSKDKADFNDCSNAGNVAEKLGFKDKHAWQSYELEYCLQNSKEGAPESIYKSLVLANRLGIIGSTTNWNKTINGGELVSFMIETYSAVNKRDGFVVNAKIGSNVGQSLVMTEVEEPETEIEETTTLGGVTISEVLDVTDLDDLFGVYGEEIDMTDEEIAEAYAIAENFTFEPCDMWKVVDFCSYLNVRTGPSTDYRILRSVPKGTKAHIVGRCVENGWYRVVTQGKIVYQCGVYFSDITE